MPSVIRRLRECAPGISILLLLSTSLLAQAAPGGTLQATRFNVAKDGVVLATFETCRGLGSSSEVVEIREGGTNVVQKIPGRLNLSDVICTRSVSNDIGLAAWRALVEQGNVDEARSDVSIVGLSASGEAVLQWQLSNAWPAELQVVGGTTATVELLRLVHEGIQRIEP